MPAIWPSRPFRGKACATALPTTNEAGKRLAVGGWLAMSEAELVFVAHRFNLQSDPLVILRSRIVNCGPCWTKFLGIIPLLPNSMAITTDDGKTHRFVLWNRGVWIAELQKDEL